jgi:glycosyltransferase involved in cell wall biosynthesis
MKSFNKGAMDGRYEASQGLLDDPFGKRSVSIVIPCFNYGVYVGQAVESAFRQGPWVGEVIVVDDGSDDPYTIEKICQIEEGAEEDLQIVRLSANQGVAEARNTGIRQAKYPFVLVLDADDELLPGFLDRAVPILCGDERCGAVTSDAVWQGSASRFRPKLSARRADLLAGPCLYSMALFRKRDWETIGGYSSEFVEAWEDHDFWLSLLELGKSIHLLPEAFFCYRRHGSSRDTWVCDQARQEGLQARMIRKHLHLFADYAEEFLAGLREQDASHRERCLRRWKTSSRAVRLGIGIDRVMTRLLMAFWKVVFPGCVKQEQNSSETLANGIHITWRSGWPEVVTFPQRVEAAWVDTPKGSVSLLPVDGYFQKFTVPSFPCSLPYRIRFLNGAGKRKTGVFSGWSRFRQGRREIK